MNEEGETPITKSPLRSSAVLSEAPKPQGLSGSKFLRPTPSPKQEQISLRSS